MYFYLVNEILNYLCKFRLIYSRIYKLSRVPAEFVPWKGKMPVKRFEGGKRSLLPVNSGAHGTFINKMGHYGLFVIWDPN